MLSKVFNILFNESNHRFSYYNINILRSIEAMNPLCNQYLDWDLSSPLAIGVINGGRGGRPPRFLKLGGGAVNPRPPQFFSPRSFIDLLFFTMNATIHSTDSFARFYKNKLLIQTTVINYHLMV